MASKLDRLRLNGREVKLSDIDLKLLLECSGNLDIRKVDNSGSFESVSLFGVFFMFKDGKASSMFISQSNEDYIGKVVLIDSCGNEIDIQDKYNLVSMLYCDNHSIVIKGNNVSPYVSINDYDNIECKMSINRSGITLMYDILNSVIVDNLSDKLGQLVNRRKRYR